MSIYIAYANRIVEDQQQKSSSFGLSDVSLRCILSLPLCFKTIFPRQDLTPSLEKTELHIIGKPQANDSRVNKCYPYQQNLCQKEPKSRGKTCT